MSICKSAKLQTRCNDSHIVTQGTSLTYRYRQYCVGKSAARPALKGPGHRSPTLRRYRLRLPGRQPSEKVAHVHHEGQKAPARGARRPRLGASQTPRHWRGLSAPRSQGTRFVKRTYHHVYGSPLQEARNPSNRLTSAPRGLDYNAPKRRFIENVPKEFSSVGACAL